jgi:hypothetical protein
MAGDRSRSCAVNDIYLWPAGIVFRERRFERITQQTLVAWLVQESNAPPTIQEGSNSEVFFDGLHAVDNAIFRSSLLLCEHRPR